ncbi:stage III sporulation protein SpoIIIAB [Paenibacillus mucilaginosus]|uniref:Sporulation stage III protein AB n=4 Tax=Paenibacillus mucilaginosus TaxID=61624 RepID=H6NL71_9BACL|nr:stage III sporulation protein SpoIIIAB [Paenibacillus mucilaginosus]AEI41225.1 Sporulation stage III protein AB [Paenibacillus mucilaginosus KNP414]AFC29778.1 Sporulation stage III protein AB [Paenibacillus mucilaginosus 3016]AFH61963.1 stage III sporulation protein AB [Paenibacillus mucilaginosus K02]MCG7211352.1 stage III sporulation protein AB [Paenibacillus mucilaginosus]WDM30263.1 stage III sporulation protein AB [Paenibacillus mucilaginosus]
MLKLLGAALVLLAGTLMGFHQAAQLARRPKQIADLIRLLQRLETEIVYGFTPLPEALRRTGGTCAAPVGTLFLETSRELERAEGEQAAGVWERTITRGWRATAMKPQEREVLLQLGTTLGLTDREDQVKHLRLAVSQLQAESETARDEQQRYERMWKSLGVLLGALVVILMY